MSNFQGGMQAGQGIGSIFTGITNADAATAQGKYTQQQFGVEAQLAQLQGSAAGIEGNLEEMALGQKSAREIGVARASFANQGVTSNSGSAESEEAQISRINALNASTLKNQVWQKQFGYSFQSMEDINQGAMARLGADTNAKAEMTTGILSGLNYGAKAAETFYQGSSADVPSGEVSAFSNPDKDTKPYKQAAIDQWNGTG